jgi:hypothetical protein
MPAGFIFGSEIPSRFIHLCTPRIHVEVPVNSDSPGDGTPIQANLNKERPAAVNKLGRSKIISQLGNLGPWEHLCLIYDTQEEWSKVVPSFLRIGLEHGEKCLYVTASRKRKEIALRLAACGLVIENEERSGQLSIALWNQLGFGNTSPQHIVTFLTKQTDAALSEGYSGLRVTIEMNAVKSLGLKGIADIESCVNAELVKGLPLMLLCQYHRPPSALVS